LSTYRVQDLVVLANNALSDGACRNFQTIKDELFNRAIRGSGLRREDEDEAFAAFVRLPVGNCPPPNTPYIHTPQTSPASGQTPRHVLTDNELRRVVAISRDHVFADPAVGQRVEAARQQMRDGIARGDRPLYDEGLAALNALKAELRLAFNTLISMPLDPGLETRESKTRRIGLLLADGRAVYAMASELVFPAEKKPAAKPRAKPKRKTTRTRVHRQKQKRKYGRPDKNDTTE
jgi:hypothetical protein